MRRMLGVLAIALGACSTSPASSDPAAPETSITPDPSPTTSAPTPMPTGTSTAAPPSGPTCPTAPPFDADDPKLASCTRPVYLMGGPGMRRVVSFDLKTIAIDIDERRDAGNDEFQTWGVAVGRGRLVIAGDGGLYTSDDVGATWVKNAAITGASFALHSCQLAFDGTHFVLVGNGGTWTSVDGLTWTGAAGETLLPGGVKGSFPGHSSGLALSGTKILVVNDNARYRFFDGAVWSESVVLGGYSGYMTNAAFGNGRFVATGDGNDTSVQGLRATSTDGKTWPEVVTNGTPGATQIRFGTVLWDGTKFLSTGTVYGSDEYTSPDGMNWTHVAANARIGPALFTNGVYAGIGSDGQNSYLFTSADGITWTPGAKDTSALGLSRIAVGRVLR